MRRRLVWGVTAKACLSTLPDFVFLPRAVDLHFVVLAADWLEARAIVAAYLHEEGLVPHRLVRAMVGPGE